MQEARYVPLYREQMKAYHRRQRLRPCLLLLLVLQQHLLLLQHFPAFQLLPPGWQPCHQEAQPLARRAAPKPAEYGLPSL